MQHHFPTRPLSDLRGRDDRPVRANSLRKSIGAERTFFTDLLEKGELLQALEPIIEEVWQRVERSGAAGRTITLKVKFAAFRQMTRAHSFSVAVASRTEFERNGRNLICAQIPQIGRASVRERVCQYV